MRIIIPMLMFTTACAEAPETPADNEDAAATMDSDIVRTKNAFLNRWVDSRYNVVCYSCSHDDLECFPISDEGTAQYRLDFQNQAD